MNEYVSSVMNNLRSADISVVGPAEFRRMCQRLSQCLEHCDMEPEQYSAALELLTGKEKLLQE